MERILQYIGSLDSGGAQSAIMSLYETLDRQRYQLDFITHQRGETDMGRAITALGGRTFYIEPFTGGNLRSFRRSWASFFERHPEYGVIHSHMRSTASLVVPIAKKAALATIVHAHSMSNGSGAVAAVKDMLRLPIRKQADFLVACSSEAGRWLFGEKACREDRYLYLPNAIDLRCYSFNEGWREEVQAGLGLSGRLVFGHVGRMHESKNHMFLLEVFARLRGRWPGSALLLVGDGPLCADVERRAIELGLGDDVLFLGNRPDVPALLSAMDVFLFPSKWEGLPVSVVEALASGLPCYVSDAVTHDVDICDAVHRLPIADPSVWAERVRPEGRANHAGAIKAHGFAIEDSAALLEELYSRAVNLAASRKEARRD